MGVKPGEETRIEPAIRSACPLIAVRAVEQVLRQPDRINSEFNEEACLQVFQPRWPALLTCTAPFACPRGKWVKDEGCVCDAKHAAKAQLPRIDREKELRPVYTTRSAWGVRKWSGSRYESTAPPARSATSNDRWGALRNPKILRHPLEVGSCI